MKEATKRTRFQSVIAVGDRFIRVRLENGVAVTIREPFDGLTVIKEPFFSGGTVTCPPHLLRG